MHTNGCGCGSCKHGNIGFLTCCGLRVTPPPPTDGGACAPEARRSIDWLAWDRTIGSEKGGSGPVRAAAKVAELEGVRRWVWWAAAGSDMEGWRGLGRREGVRGGELGGVGVEGEGEEVEARREGRVEAEEEGRRGCEVGLDMLLILLYSGWNGYCNLMGRMKVSDLARDLGGAAPEPHPPNPFTRFDPSPNPSPTYRR